MSERWNTRRALTPSSAERREFEGDEDDVRPSPPLTRGEKRFAGAVGASALLAASWFGGRALDEHIQREDVRPFISAVEHLVHDEALRTPFSFREHPQWRQLESQDTPLERSIRHTTRQLNDDGQLEDVDEYESVPILRPWAQRWQQPGAEQDIYEVSFRRRSWRAGRALRTFGWRDEGSTRYSVRLAPSRVEARSAFDTLTLAEKRDVQREFLQVEAIAPSWIEAMNEAGDRLLDQAYERQAAIAVPPDRFVPTVEPVNGLVRRVDRYNGRLTYFYNHPVTRLGQEVPVAAVLIDDSVSYFQHVQWRLTQVQVEGRMQARALVSAQWVHDSGERFAR